MLLYALMLLWFPYRYCAVLTKPLHPACTLATLPQEEFVGALFAARTYLHKVSNLFVTGQLPEVPQQPLHDDYYRQRLAEPHRSVPNFFTPTTVANHTSHDTKHGRDRTAA